MAQDTQDLPFDELARRFERSCVYDCHSTWSKFRQSEARQELARRGIDVLEEVLDYLQDIVDNRYTHFITTYGAGFVDELKLFWTALIHDLGWPPLADQDPDDHEPDDRKPSGPGMFMRVETWIKLARTRLPTPT